MGRLFYVPSDLTCEGISLSRLKIKNLIPPVFHPAEALHIS